MLALPSLCCLNISNVAHKGWGGGLCVAWTVCKATKKPYNGVSHLGCSSTPDIRRGVIYQGWRNQQGYSQMEGRVCAIIYEEIWRQAGRHARLWKLCHSEAGGPLQIAVWLLRGCHRPHSALHNFSYEWRQERKLTEREVVLPCLINSAGKEFTRVLLFWIVSINIRNNFLQSSVRLTWVP